MSDRDFKLVEVSGWAGMGLGVAIGAVFMALWPLGVLLSILGACGIIVALVMEPEK